MIEFQITDISELQYLQNKHKLHQIKEVLSLYILEVKLKTKSYSILMILEKQI